MRLLLQSSTTLNPTEGGLVEGVTYMIIQIVVLNRSIASGVRDCPHDWGWALRDTFRHAATTSASEESLVTPTTTPYIPAKVFSEDAKALLAESAAETIRLKGHWRVPRRTRPSPQKALTTQMSTPFLVKLARRGVSTGSPAFKTASQQTFTTNLILSDSDRLKW